MEQQMSLFNQTGVNINDIRTEKQKSRSIAYDCGEKIGNSRKDMAALKRAFEEIQSKNSLANLELYSPTLAAEMVNKKNMFHSFSLEKEKGNGVHPGVAKAKQLLIQRIDSDPDDTIAARETFLNAANYVKEAFNDIYTFNELLSLINLVYDHLLNERKKPEFYHRQIKQLQNELMQLESTDDKKKKLLSDLSNFEKTLVAIKTSKSLQLSILGKKFYNFFMKRSSQETTMKKIAAIESWDELIKKKQGRLIATRKKAWSRILPERPDRKGGAQSVIERPEDLISFFKFRGVEFGHYVDDHKGNEHLLRSSEAMMDLAEILGIEYQATSLNGTLGIGYGSRGSGNALAHYEPVAKVINMTKEKGCLGVFAHEYFHALDNYIFDKSHNFQNGKIGFASEPDTLGSHIDPLVQIIFYELIDTIKSGRSTAYIQNKNTSNSKGKASSIVKSIYLKHSGELFECMDEFIQTENKKMEDSIKFFSYYNYADEKNKKKLKVRKEKNINSFAQALAWLHEAETGIRIEYIPYPSNYSTYFSTALKMDSKQKKFASNVELTARAFEAYIQDTLTSNGRRSDYLVAGTRDPIAYPMDEERLKINKKFDTLISYLKNCDIIN
ncbi:LPD1 domain-containing protein [Cytobacillus purgationiresistens]|uniref:Large polyvalent protein-associated domain-containing protein n=1 Tax=Cytobacillus purgationiresistens TaxID=863449 RepID=A0ABU0AIY7_9BACI|nr:LPD1 domain-containing protein [Cytobacillus purgationiresistens]MDQ0271227.1 hypothetical protein [Cytobacillus purgationiresistens]